MRPPTALLPFRSVKSSKLSCPAAFGSSVMQVGSVGDVDIVGPLGRARRNDALGEDPHFRDRRNGVECEGIIGELVDPGRIKVIVKLSERHGEQSAANDEIIADFVGNVRQIDGQGRWSPS